MKYNRFNIEVDLTNQPEGVYRYELILNDFTIYNGKLFKLENQNKVIIDITDILLNYKYKGGTVFKPTLKNGIYQQGNPTNYYYSYSKTLDINTGFIVCTIRYKIYDSDNNTIINDTKTFELYDYQNPLYSNNTPYKFGSMIPRLPRTDKIGYPQTNISTEIYYNLYNISGDTINYNNDVILKIDENCIAPYYLIWILKSGSYQVQPFNGYCSYTETVTNNYKLSIDDQKDIANQTLNRKWNLKSDNLTDTEYKYFMDILTSPYLLLYDYMNNETIYVNCTDNSKEQKTNSNNNGKPIFFEVNLEARNLALNIY